MSLGTDAAWGVGQRRRAEWRDRAKLARLPRGSASRNPVYGTIASVCCGDFNITAKSSLMPISAASVTPKSSTESKREFTPTPSPLVPFQMCPWVISESECGSIHRVGRFQIFLVSLACG